METDGLLSSQWESSSRSPHLRRIYELTPAGRVALSEQTRVVRDLDDQLCELCE
jgi:DNA-binding PadR family transcriptional regulator